MADTREITVSVNGQSATREVETRLNLADFLRHELELTGTHVGCEHGACGACTVLVDGEAVRSCLMLAVQANGQEVTTVEGLAADDGATVLTYDVEARVGGKLAQIGSRLIDSTAKKFADDFFGRFAGEVAGPTEPETPAEAAPETAEASATEAADAAVGSGLAPGIWATGVFVIVLLLLAIFGLG